MRLLPTCVKLNPMVGLPWSIHSCRNLILCGDVATEWFRTQVEVLGTGVWNLGEGELVTMPYHPLNPDSYNNWIVKEPSFLMRVKVNSASPTFPMSRLLARASTCPLMVFYRLTREERMASLSRLNLSISCTGIVSIRSTYSTG